MSTNLVWEIIKNNSSFLRKQVRGNKVTTFSADPMNLTATYSYFLCARSDVQP